MFGVHWNHGMTERHGNRRIAWSAAALAALFLCAACPAALLASQQQSEAGEASTSGERDAALFPEAESLGQELREILSQLDSEQFVVRHRAAQRLRRLVSESAAQSVIADELRRIWRDAGTSFEVRSHIEPLLEDLSELPRSTDSDVVTEAEIEALVDALDADSYSDRLGAATRLEWMLDQERWICPIMLRLKARLADPDLTAADRHRVDALWRRARGAWLMSDPAGWKLPDVPEEQIHRWIVQLTQEDTESEPENTSSPWRVAPRELLDLLCRESYLPGVTRELAAQIERDDLVGRAIARLEQVYNWTRPALVAEYWDSSGNRGVQHLLIGVPSMPGGAARASHFDYADDEKAHCVSGNNLTPGDWPVGVAFPHPSQSRALFNLVNLPTPRRRMAYEHYVRLDPSQRLEDLSHRTLEAVLSAGRPLTDEELGMIVILDRGVVSRFAGRYLESIDDRPGVVMRDTPAAGQPSHHGALCMQLARVGTREAVPGILRAVEQGRIEKPRGAAPYDFPWVAVLTIARRDPWPGVQAWLADLVPRKYALRIGGTLTICELGATAAGLLLERRGNGPDAFHLALGADTLLTTVINCRPYYFTDEKGRDQVLEWWSAVNRMTLEDRNKRHQGIRRG